MVGVCRWLGVHKFSASDTTKPFPNEAPNITKGQLRTAYDGYYAFVRSRYNRVNARDGLGWSDGFWFSGDYLDGDSSGVYNQSQQMHVFSQYLLAEGFRIGDAVLDTVGPNNWSRQFNISLIRAQERRNVNTNSIYPFGRVVQQNCLANNHSCHYGNGEGTTAHAGNILTPKNFVHDSVIGCYDVFGVDSIIACDSLTWINGITYTSSNYTATDTLISSRGCDSIVSLKLTIKRSALYIDTIVACVSHQWIDSVNYSASNYSATKLFPGGASNGCDSIVQLHLTINQPVNATDTQTACVSYTWVDGNTYASNNNSATYTFANGAANGCDSIVTLNLTILQPVTAVDTQTACMSYTWIDGNTYASSNTTATHVIPNGAANGCDSIVNLHLTILQSVTAVDTQTACGSFTWIDGNTYASNNTTATHTIQNGASNGCDSIVRLHLTILQPVTGVDTQVACGSYTWIDGNTYASSNSSARFTIANGASNGCDSIVSLNLTILQPVTAVDTHVTCGNFTWIDGTTYASSNISARYTYVNGASNGCDSIVQLHLTVNRPSSSTQSITACDSYTWPVNNRSYTSSGTYVDTLLNRANCDSIITLVLTINRSTMATIQHTACDSYTWPLNNRTYTMSGTYVDTIMNASNCDSVVTLHLTVNPSSGSSVSETACGAYTWPLNNVRYASSGVYTHTLSNSRGCDSIITLNLTILNSSSSTVNESACVQYT